MYQTVDFAMGEQAAGQELYLRGQTSLNLARHAGPHGGLYCKADLVVAWVKRSLESCIAYESDTLLTSGPDRHVVFASFLMAHRPMLSQ